MKDIENCENCGVPFLTDDGQLDIIVLDGKCLCENCADKRQYGKIIAQDVGISCDFDYSMNF